MSCHHESSDDTRQRVARFRQRLRCVISRKKKKRWTAAECRWNNSWRDRERRKNELRKRRASVHPCASVYLPPPTLSPVGLALARSFGAAGERSRFARFFPPYRSSSCAHEKKNKIKATSSCSWSLTNHIIVFFFSQVHVLLFYIRSNGLGCPAVVAGT